MHHITHVVNDFEAIFKFNAVTPVESNAVWLVVGWMFSSTVIEVSFGGANIFVCAVQVYSFTT